MSACISSRLWGTNYNSTLPLSIVSPSLCPCWLNLLSEGKGLSQAEALVKDMLPSYPEDGTWNSAFTMALGYGAGGLAGCSGHSLFDKVVELLPHRSLGLVK